MAASAASDQQLALARQSRPGSAATLGTLSRAARQTVPPFLQKLYEMVSEDATNDLIRWSDAGDSFYVYDADRFAREVLGRWFKHQNFQSFVRQLNMYGFHKIPHLQQSTLRSQPTAETWQFEQPHFLRGQPDMLVLIQRKKQDNASGGRAKSIMHQLPPPLLPAALPAPTESPYLENSANPPQGSTSAQQVAPPASTPEGPLDAVQIAAGIHAVKRHQAAISTELAELRTANARLWAEAIAARERHNKHQDTIAKILRFLGTVFGPIGAGPPAPAGRSSDEGEAERVVPRKRQRLMIGHSEKGDVRREDMRLEVPRMEEEPEEDFLIDPPTPELRFATIDTPAPSDTISPANTPALTPVSTHSNYPFPPSITRASGSAEPPGRSNQDGPTANGDVPPAGAGERPLSPSTLNALMPANQYSGNDNVQTAINQLLSSPDQMQRLLQALAQQQQSPAFPLPHYPETPTAPNQAGQTNGYGGPNPGWNNQHLLHFDQPWDTTQFQSAPAPPQPSGAQSQPQASSSSIPPYVPNAYAPPMQQLPLPPPPPRSDFPSHEADVGRLQRNWTNTAEIGADVDALQQHIDSLIASMGLDPALVGDGPSPAPSIPADPSAAHGMSGIAINGEGTHDSTESGDELSFEGLEAFMQDFQRAREEGGEGATAAHHPHQARDVPPEQVSAFLDEVASQASGDPGSPTASLNAFGVPPQASGSPEIGTGKGRKRKSDTVRLSPLDAMTSAKTGGAAESGKGRRKK